MKIKVPIEISVRHVHLSSADVEQLFGSGYSLKPAKQLSQPNQFLAQERVKLVGPKGKIDNVAIVGPGRVETQVELCQTDALNLGLGNVPVLASGNLEQSLGGLTLIGPDGQVKLNKEVIIAQRHLHISAQQAQEFDLKTGDIIKLRTTGNKAVIFENILVRSRAGVDELALHLDTDEANAAGVKRGDQGIIIK